MPLVTIAVPTYEGAAYLEPCLASAVGQSFGDLEILVVDDCSTDGTLEIAAEFARRDRRVNIHRNRRRLGLVANWNQCLSLSSGEWIKFLFQDDLLRPDCLARMLTESGARFDFIVAERDFLIEEGTPAHLRSFYEKRILRLSDVFPEQTEIQPRMFAEAILGHGVGLNFVGEPTSALIHRKVWRRFSGFNEDLLHLCDLEYWTRLGSNQAFLYIPHNLALFRVHGQAASVRHHAKQRFRLEHLDKLILLHDYLYRPYYQRLREVISASERLLEQLKAEMTLAVQVAAASAGGAAKEDLEVLLRRYLALNDLAKSLGKSEDGAGTHSGISGTSTSVPSKRSAEQGVSIIIPTLNGGKRFEECLSAIRTQDYRGEVRLIVVDSGSTDGTVAAAERAGALVKGIERESFHHARTRNMALDLTKNPMVVFMVQDAVPSGRTWLSGLATTLDEYDVTAAYAGQDPHDDAQPYARFEVESHSEYLGTSPSIQALESREAFEALPYEQAYRSIRMDNVCAIYRREALLETPFPEVDFAEDMAWALAAMPSGHRILYQPEVRVKHSHNRPAEYVFKRQIVNAVWVARIMGRVEKDLSFLGAGGLLLIQKRVGERAGQMLNESVLGGSENGEEREKDFAVGSIFRHAALPFKLRLRFMESCALWKRPAEEVCSVVERVTREMDHCFGLIRNRYALTDKEALFELLDQLSAMSLGKIFGQAYVCNWLKGSRMNGLAGFVEGRWMDL